MVHKSIIVIKEGRAKHSWAKRYVGNFMVKTYIFAR
jgi:hypothetical protein